MESILNRTQKAGSLHDFVQETAAHLNPFEYNSDLAERYLLSLQEKIALCTESDLESYRPAVKLIEHLKKTYGASNGDALAGFRENLLVVRAELAERIAPMPNVLDLYPPLKEGDIVLKLVRDASKQKGTNELTSPPTGFFVRCRKLLSRLLPRK